MKYEIFYYYKDNATNRDIFRTCSLSQFKRDRVEKEQSFIAETDDVKSIIKSVRDDKDKKYSRYVAMGD